MRSIAMCIMIGIGVLVLGAIVGCEEETTNTAPVIDSFHADPASVYPNDRVTLTVSATDPEGENLTYTYAASGGTITGTGDTVTWIAPETSGSYVISVDISDGELSIQSTVTIECAEELNTAPVISWLRADPTSVDPNGQAILITSAADPEGDTLTYTYEASGGVITGTGDTVTWIAPDTAGSYEINVSVSDGELSAQGTIAIAVASTYVSDMFDEDIIETADGDLKITFIGHATLMLTFGGKIIHIDPVFAEADYNKMPKADLIVITHEHGDHFDTNAINAIRNGGTEIVLTEICARTVAGGIVMKNGDVKTVGGLKFEAVPAYNIVHKRANGQPYHPKGDGNGYVITFGDKRVYVAGDTENTPEMKQLKDIDIAFLPMNLPYTMTPEMVADATKALRPKILYPYHFSNTDTSEIVELLEGEEGIEVRIRDMP